MVPIDITTRPLDTCHFKSPKGSSLLHDGSTLINYNTAKISTNISISIWNSTEIIHFISILCFWRIQRPIGGYCEALITSMIESQDITSKHTTDIFHTAKACAKGCNRPMGDMERSIYNGMISLFGCLLFQNKLNERGKVWHYSVWKTCQVSFSCNWH